MNLDPCLSISIGQSITFYEEVEASISVAPAVCENLPTQLTINISGPGNYNVIYNDGSDNILLSAISDGYTIDIMPVDGATYTINQISNINAPFCTGEVPPATGSVTINTTSGVTTANLIEACNYQAGTYVVTFEIQGGYAPGYYVNNGNGTLTGSSFVSDPIPIGTPYAFEVGDGVCPDISQAGLPECNCETTIGTMGLSPLMGCQGESITASYDFTEVLDDDDALGFVLHDGISSPLGNIYATSPTPTFSYLPSMTLGTTYFITAVAGNDDGSGFPVLSLTQDECLVMSNNQPITFYAAPEVLMSGPTVACEGDTLDITLTISHTGNYNIAWTDGTITDTLYNVYDGYVWGLEATQSATYSLLSITGATAPFCEGEVSSIGGSLTVDVAQGPSMTNMVITCDSARINYTISFDIVGGNPDNYIVFGIWGTLTGNTFVSDPILGGTPYDFTINDGGPCPEEVYGNYYCECKPDMAPMMTLEEPISCYGMEDGQVHVDGFSGTSPYVFSWSNGFTGEEVTNLSAGWHYVTMTDANACQVTDSVFLNEPTALVSSVEVTEPTCFGGDDATLTFLNTSGGVGDYQYALDVISSFQGNQFYSLEAGTYIATVIDDHGCTWSDTVTIESPPELTIETTPDTEIVLGDSVELFVISNYALDTFYWSQLPGICEDCLTQYIYPHQTITLTVSGITDDGCIAEEEVTIVVTKENPVFVPNAFSPNGDGVNDRLNVFAGISVNEVKTFNVYNRWGGLLYSRTNFQPNEENTGWNGSFKGRELDPGIYVYFLEVEFVDGSTQVISGDVLLMR